MTQEQIAARLIPVEQAFISDPSVSVTGPQATRFANGGALSLSRVKTDVREGSVRVCGPDGAFLGLGRIDTVCGELQVLRLFPHANES